MFCLVSLIKNEFQLMTSVVNTYELLFAGLNVRHLSNLNQTIIVENVSMCNDDRVLLLVSV